MNYQIEAADMAMDGTANEGTSNIRQEYNLGRVGLDMDSSVNQVQKGKLSYALNAALENFDANSVSYQNEPSNELCLNFPEGFHLIGTHFIQEKSKHIFFLTNPETGASEIGYMDNNDCVYHTLCTPIPNTELTVCANSDCLNFDINHPIHKAVHKITNCSTEVYWTDGLNPRRYIDIDQVPYITTYLTDETCDPQITAILDCNKLKVQPNFQIPNLEVSDIVVGGDLKAGTYQFAIQYSNASGDGYTSYYSITNPTSIANTEITTPNFDYSVGKSIVLNISNLDVTGYFQYFNLAVIKTINNGTTVELVGTYNIEEKSTYITYTGQNQTQIPLSLNDILEKFPYYDIAQDVTNVQDIIVWDNLTSVERINYQGIANQIALEWETYKLPANNTYADGFYTANLRGYLRDEVYAFEIVFLLDNGRQTDGFHIPGRAKNYLELSQPDVTTANPDYVGDGTPQPYWKIYNTASVSTTYPAPTAATPKIGEAYPYQSGEFAYWESTDTYPCNTDVWGDLAGKPIRHHKFPDVLVSPYFESPTITYAGGQIQPVMQAANAIYPIGVKIDVQQVASLIQSSNLTDEEKSSIVGFKIVRGNRSTNKSIIAKGILRNVGKYTRENPNDPNATYYYYPNYPYNDLSDDPFLLERNNAYNSQCDTFSVSVTSAGTLQYTDCYTGEVGTQAFTGSTTEICSITLPTVITGSATFTNITATSYVLSVTFPVPSNATFQYTDSVTGALTNIIVYYGNPLTVNSTTVPKRTAGSPLVNIVATNTNENVKCYPSKLNGFDNVDSPYRQVFNSPETSFGQPTLGNVLKLESVLFGGGKAHFVEVEKHAKYKLINEQTQINALNSSKKIADLGGFSATAFFTAYQTYLQIYINGISRQNFAYSFNSRSSYDYSSDVPNGQGVKQRQLDNCQYVFPGVQSVGDNYDLNNWNRESSVYIKTIDTRTNVPYTVSPLPYPNQTPSLVVAGVSQISDSSRFTISEAGNCASPEAQKDIKVVSYYGSIKTINNNQWGQIYSYDTIDTGFQRIFNALPANDAEVVFGGDTYIGKFGFKTKLPFFIDNRVNAPDDSDIYYDELGNVAYPQYWYSARSILSDYYVGSTLMKNIISTKAHYLDCPNDSIIEASTSSTTSTTSTTPPVGTVVSGSLNYVYDGKMYLFAYGIPYYYVETSINIDLRQAFNNLEGDFYPHVSSGIPDEWFQESRVPIAFDNTYYYNTTYSKQNVENSFSHLPADWVKQLCYVNYPFRAIYSDPQQSYTDNRINSWLIYRPVSFFDFPQNYGKLISLDGIQNRATLARFENKTLLYGNLLTINTSNPQAAYLGNPSLFGATPPIDYAETDLGYVGSQNKFLLKIPNGQITVDAKRGQIFLIQGTQAVDISGFGSGLNRFFTDHLSFEILRYFPTVNTDNHFNGLGLHGVFDSKFERIIITKLDYIPQPGKQIYYDDVEQRFYINKPTAGNTSVKTFVNLTDVEYFCNKSWTASFNLNTKAWVSFHTYLPNFYIGENNFFYSGLNEGCDITAVAVTEVPSPTTTTTTTVIRYCNLSGTAVVTGYPCLLEGTAAVETTTTTTSSSTSTSTTSTTTTPVPTTTTTTTPGPVTPEWYYIYDCTSGSIVTSTNYAQGTFSLNDTVYSPITGRYYYISNISATNPGPPNYYIQYYGGTLCPDTTTTTTTLPPLTLTLTVLCDNVGTYQGKVVATWSGGSGNGYQIRAGYGFSFSSYRSMGTTQTLIMTSDTNPYDGTSGLRNTTGGSDVFAVQVIDNNGTGAFNSTTQITSINCGTTTTTTTPAPTTTTTTTPTPGPVDVSLVYGSMEPCFGGSIDDHMGAHVILSSAVNVTTNFLVQVSYVGIGNTCGVGESTQSFPVIVPAGSSSDNFQACVDGAYFPAGAVVCSACILSCDNPAVNLTGATC